MPISFYQANPLYQHKSGFIRKSVYTNANLALLKKASIPKNWALLSRIPYQRQLSFIKQNLAQITIKLY